MRLGFLGLGDKTLRLAAQWGLVGNRLGQLLGGDFGTVWGPVGVGAQEHLLATQLGLLQRAEQVRGRNVVRRHSSMEILVQIGVHAGRFHFTQMLGYRRTLAGTIAITSWIPWALSFWRTPSTSA